MVDEALLREVRVLVVEAVLVAPARAGGPQTGFVSSEGTRGGFPLASWGLKAPLTPRVLMIR